jgi:hypothetical protein
VNAKPLASRLQRNEKGKKLWTERSECPVDYTTLFKNYRRDYS